MDRALQINKMKVLLIIAFFMIFFLSFVLLFSCNSNKSSNNYSNDKCRYKTVSYSNTSFVELPNKEGTTTDDIEISKILINKIDSTLLDSGVLINIFVEKVSLCNNDTIRLVIYDIDSSTPNYNYKDLKLGVFLDGFKMPIYCEIFNLMNSYCAVGVVGMELPENIERRKLIKHIKETRGQRLEQK